LESAQFSNGSLDVTLQGPESGLVGSPVAVRLYLPGATADNLVAELSGIAGGLNEIADAIREAKAKS